MSKYDEDCPPPYSPAPANPTSALPLQTPESAFTAHLAAHLSSLPDLIRNAQSAHLSTQQFRDNEVLCLIVPHIETLLSDLAYEAAHPSPNTPSLAELTLVPAAACPKEWKWTEQEERRGTLRRLVRVEPGSRKVDGDSKKANYGDREREDVDLAERMTEGERGRHTEFDEWGRWGSDAGAGESSSSGDRWSAGEWWWSDEEAAARLARQLQPPRNPASSPTSPSIPANGGSFPSPVHRAPTELPPREKEKKSKWGFFRSAAKEGIKEGVEGIMPIPLPSVSVSGISGLVRRGTFSDQSDRPSENGRPFEGRRPSESGRPFEAGGAPADAQVSMTVRPEEVTLRRENDFGIWESKNGWGIVVKIRVPKGQF